MTNPQPLSKPHAPAAPARRQRSRNRTGWAARWAAAAWAEGGCRQCAGHSLLHGGGMVAGQHPAAGHNSKQGLASPHAAHSAQWQLYSPAALLPCCPRAPHLLQCALLHQPQVLALHDALPALHPVDVATQRVDLACRRGRAAGRQAGLPLTLDGSQHKSSWHEMNLAAYR